MTKITVFTDADLDGASCVLVLKWLFPKWKITHKATNEKDFRAVYNAWLDKDEYNKHDKVFICDLNIIEACNDLIDAPKVVVIDHHKDTQKTKIKFMHATVHCDITPSCASLVYKTFVNESKEILNNYQKLLINLIDDYDAYILKYPTSLNLNTIFYSMQGDRIGIFCAKFAEGFKGFDKQQDNIIHFHKLKVKQTIEELQVFKTSIPLNNKPYTLVSTFADYALNEVAQHILYKHNADISVIINLKNNTVSFRKQKNLNYDISILARKLADGDGNENAAGGILTPQMLAFAKMFTPI